VAPTPVPARRARRVRSRRMPPRSVPPELARVPPRRGPQGAAADVRHPRRGAAHGTSGARAFFGEPAARPRGVSAVQVGARGDALGCVLYTGPHTTASAW
jgi:hypothetical protein